MLENEHILLCRTNDLSTNFYFLPGGHIEPGEKAEEAVLRELKEEAGQIGHIRQFLGCFENHFPPGANSICHNHEYNFIFLVSLDNINPNSNDITSQESHITFHWQPLSRLTSLDFRPASLQPILPKWLSQSENRTFESNM